jgi:hypothetical protein
MRLAALRLANCNVLYAKEPNSPVVLALFMLEPLSDAQLRHLSVASPWNPVMIDADVDYSWHEGYGFGASISSIETLPRIAIIPPKRHLRPGVYKRKRGFLFHD